MAGKSTLNRLELSRETPTKYRKIAHEPAAILATATAQSSSGRERPSPSYEKCALVGREKL